MRYVSTAQAAQNNQSGSGVPIKYMDCAPSETVKSGHIAVRLSNGNLTYGLPPDAPSAALRPIYSDGVLNGLYRAPYFVANLTSLGDKSLVSLGDGTIVIATIYNGNAAWIYRFGPAGDWIGLQNFSAADVAIGAAPGNGYALLFADAAGAIKLGLYEPSHAQRVAPIALEAAAPNKIGNVAATVNGNIVVTWLANVGGIDTPKYAVYNGTTGAIVKAATVLKAGVAANSGWDLVPVRALANGGFVVGYAIPTGAANVVNKFWRLFDNAGNPSSAETLYRTYAGNSYGEIMVAALTGGGFAVFDPTDGAFAIFDAAGVVKLAIAILDAGIFCRSMMTPLADGNVVLLWLSGTAIKAAYAKGDGTYINTKTLATSVGSGQISAIGLPDGGFVLSYGDANGKMITESYSPGQYWARTKTTNYTEYMTASPLASRVPGVALVNPVRPEVMTWLQCNVGVPSSTFQYGLHVFNLPACTPEGIFTADAAANATVKIQCSGDAVLYPPTKARFSVDARLSQRAGIKVTGQGNLVTAEF